MKIGAMALTIWARFAIGTFLHSRMKMFRYVAMASASERSYCSSMPACRSAAERVRYQTFHSS